MRTSDIMRSTEMITVESAFSHGRFTQGPSTSLSLQSSSRNTVALGRSTPAKAWTPVVMRPRGAPGMMTMTAATVTMALNAP